jgi:hypothetical protein
MRALHQQRGLMMNINEKGRRCMASSSSFTKQARTTINHGHCCKRQTVRASHQKDDTMNDCVQQSSYFAGAALSVVSRSEIIWLESKEAQLGCEHRR